MDEIPALTRTLQGKLDVMNAAYDTRLKEFEKMQEADRLDLQRRALALEQER